MAPCLYRSIMRLAARSSYPWSLLVGVAIAILCARVAATWRVFSDTADETYHLAAAISLFEAGKLTEGIQHPPLARILPGLVLYASGVRYPPDRSNKFIHGDLLPIDSFLAGNDLLLHSPISYWQVLIRARAAMLPFAVAAVVYVYLLGRWVAGPRMAALAAVFFSFDPTLLGNAAWVTTDVPAVAGFLAIIYHGLRWVAHPTFFRALIAGAICGLGLSCKFSCVAAIPAVLLILLLRSPRRGPWSLRRALRYLSQAALIATVAFFVLWGTYLFDIGPIGQAAPIAHAPIWFLTPAWLKQIPLPMPSFFYGLMILQQHEHAGHIAYALGMKNQGGWWWYFPFALLVKEPVALLLAVVLSLVLAIVSAVRAPIKNFSRGLGRQRPRIWLVVLLPLVIFMAWAMAGSIDIGIRHILPAIALLYLLAMLGLTRSRWPAVLVALAAGACVETAAVHPDYQAFFNFASGGPSNGQRWLLDSNLDWGQDEARLEDYLAKHAAGRFVTLRIFGFERPRDWPHADSDHGGYDFLDHEYIGGLLVVSKNIRFDLYHVSFQHDGRHQLEPPTNPNLVGLRPNAHVGYSIDIYDLDHPLASNGPNDIFAQ
jgi:dolichyl-phosphate-mannose-protein mannosyltransferase